MGDWRHGARVALIGLCALLAACGQVDLYTKLTEGQANEMVAALQTAGIESTKVDGGEQGWVLKASQADFARAIEVLRSQGYPREEFASLGTVFKKEGFVSSPTEERARLVYGMSQELSHTISEIDGVVQARVHLAIPESKPLADQAQPPSASVFIKYRPGSNVAAQVGKVKSLVVNSIEGLKVDNVSVQTFPAQALPATASAGRSGPVLSASLIGPVIGGLLLLAALIGYPGFRRWQQRRRVALVRRETDA